MEGWHCHSNYIVCYTPVEIVIEKEIGILWVVGWYCPNIVHLVAF